MLLDRASIPEESRARLIAHVENFSVILPTRLIAVGLVIGEFGLVYKLSQLQSLAMCNFRLSSSFS